jgi:hypothetical protein
MSRKSNRGKFFGRRRLQSINAAERPQEEEKAPNPLSRDGWLRWLELQWDLESAEIQD